MIQPQPRWICCKCFPSAEAREYSSIQVKQHWTGCLCSQPFPGKGKNYKGCEGDREYCSSTALSFFFSQREQITATVSHSTDWSRNHEGKNYLQNNQFWSKREEAGGRVAGGSCPELTEEFQSGFSYLQSPC